LPQEIKPETPTVCWFQILSEAVPGRLLDSNKPDWVVRQRSVENRNSMFTAKNTKNYAVAELIDFKRDAFLIKKNENGGGWGVSALSLAINCIFCRPDVVVVATNFMRKNNA
jgi:hypothetical protein